MTYKVDLLDRATFEKIKEIEIVNEPTIHEEINGSFTFDFEAHYTAKNDLTKNVIVVADGKYFKIAKVVKSRDDSISLNVHCEHVSYELIVDYELDEDMHFESNVRMMIERFLSGTRFRLVECIDTEIKYYATNTLDIRKRLFEVANLFAGELVFDNYDVSLVQQRGTDKGLEIELGVNLIGVTEETNYVENVTSYELDLLDLSNVAGYEMDFSNIEIGDTITIKDSVLGINTTERVLAIDYNPFKKALPTVVVGDYIRDLTEYLKPEPEEVDEEEKGVKSFFKQFKVGGVDMLQLSSDEGNNVREYLTDKFSLGVEASAKYNTLKDKLEGIIAEKADDASGVLSVIQTKSNENGLMVTTVTEIEAPDQLSEAIIRGVTHITLVVSDRPISYYRENREAAKNAEVHAIGICVTFNDDAGVFLEKFNVGEINILSLEGNDATDNIFTLIDFVIDSETGDVGASIPLEKVQRGIEVVPTEEYKDWHLTLLHEHNIEGSDTWETLYYVLPIENYADFKVTTYTKDYVHVMISNYSFSDIMSGRATGPDTDDLYYRVFGGTFTMEEPPANVGGADAYFDEFRIGDVDMLPLASDERNSTIDYIYYSRPVVASAIHYEPEYETLTGVFVTPKPEYADKYLVLFDYYLDLDGSYNIYQDTYADNVANYGLHDIQTPSAELQTTSFTLALFEINPHERDEGVAIEDILIASFGIQVRKEGAEISEPGNEPLFFEYGSCPLSDFMEIEFENGPYTEVRSITTGIEYRPNRAEPASVPLTASTPTPRDTVSMPNITIIVSQVRDWWDGTVTGLTAESSYPYMEDVYVNFHAVCVKGYIPPQNES